MSFLEKIKEKLPFTVGQDTTTSAEVGVLSAHQIAYDAKSGAKESSIKIEKSVESKPESSVEKSADKPGDSTGVKGFFGNILSKLSFKNEKIEPVKDSLTSAVIESAIGTQENPKEESILEAPPEVDESLLEEMEPPKSILLFILKGSFIFLFAAGLGVLLFLTSQLSNYFDFATTAIGVPSVLNELTDTNKDIKDLQTEINFNRYLQGKFYLDQFSIDGDKYSRNFYIYSNKTMSDEEKSNAKEQMDLLRENLKKSFSAASAKLGKNLGRTLIDLEVADQADVEVLFTKLLKDKLDTKLKELKDGTTEEETRDYKLYRQVRKLIENSNLMGLLKSTDFDKLSDNELQTLITQVNDFTENELSAIQKIKDVRINWSDIINQIKLETSYVDQYFSEGYFKEIGGIQYTSYDFDSASGKIIITGITKRLDTTNFTMISNLIDQLNESPYFKNVEMKSFTKTGSAKDGYTATLRLNLELQEDTLSDADKSIDVNSVPEFLTPQKGPEVNK